MMGGGTGAYALHWSGGAARCVRSHIPGALSILTGAVPGRARGLGHMAPTYFRREPGIDAPNGHGGSALICVPGAAHREVVRCKPGTVANFECETVPDAVHRFALHRV